MKTFDPDDPMLTAYALGELEGEELRDVEELIARDPEAARHVESVRAAAADFGEAFEREESPEVEPIRAVEIEPVKERRGIPFLYYISTAIGACFFIVLAIRLVNPAIDERPASKSAEIATPAATPAANAKEEAPAAMAREAAARQEALADRAENQRAALDFEKTKAATARAKLQTRELAKEDDQAAAAGSSNGSTDKPVANEMAEPPPPAAVGEMKALAKDAGAPVADLNREGAIDGDEIRLKPFSVVVAGPTTYKTVDSIRRALDARQKVTKVDVAVLLSDLGYTTTAGTRKQNADLGNTTLSQTTTEDSPQHDPEAALARSVERFAELLSMNTPSNNESWDRALADARYAAGDDAKRLEFVRVIEAARRMARGPAAP